MGRHNHENSVPIPGYGKPVILSGDDTFTSGPLSPAGSEPQQPAQSQLYSYIAKNTNDVLKDKGDLWAFVSDTPGVEDYYDVPPGSPMSITGHFIKVPRNIATGLNADGSELQSEDVGYPEPPNDGTLAAGASLAAAPSGPRRRWAAVGAPALERPERRVPVRPGRGHRLRQAARAWATSSTSPTPAGAGSGGGADDTPPFRFDQRSRLEDGLRQGRPDEGHVAQRVRRG